MAQETPSTAGGDAGWLTSERLIVWSVALALGGIHALGSVFYMNSDGISYLYLSDFVKRGEWGGLVDGCWSPLYPVIVGIISRVVDPSPYWEWPMVHALNFVLYAAAFASFRFFLASVRANQERRKDSVGEGKFVIDFRSPAASVCAHVLFLLTTLVWTEIAPVTPDLIVLVVIYAACGLAIRLRQDPRPARYLLLGVVAGVGYLTKAIMFPLAFPLLAAAAFTPRRWGLSARRALFAFIGFFIVATPQIVVVSKFAGHLTYADTGGMVYGRMVNQYPRLWVGEPDGSGTPKHPVRRILQDPGVYEYSVPDTRSSYPFWDRPTWWTAGMKPSFNLSVQIDTTLPFLAMYLTLFGPMLFVALALWFTRDRQPWTFDYTVSIVPALAVLAMYALVYSEARYLGGWASVLFIGFASSLAFPNGPAKAVRAMLLVLALFQGGELLAKTRAPFERAMEFTPGHEGAHVELEAGKRLRRMGVNKGDRVAVIGLAYTQYWARLAGVQIAMEMERHHAYWGGPDSVRTKVQEAFRSAGARGIVANMVPPRMVGPGWIPVGIGGYYYMPLNHSVPE